MNTCHVLAVDHSERGNNLAFLLRLSRFRVSLVRDELEAIIWAANNKDTAEAFELMILSHFSLAAEESKGVAGLYRLSLQIPILLVMRSDNQQHTAELLKSAPPDCRFTLCMPEDILTSAKRIRNEIREKYDQLPTDRSYSTEGDTVYE